MSDKVKKVVLAYSGGLDTSVILKWLEQKGYEVIAGLEICKINHRKSGHSGSADDTVGGAFHKCNFLFDGPAGGIVVAVIGVAVDFTVCYLAKNLEGNILVINRLDNRRNHWFVAVWGQMFSVSHI